MGWAQRSRKRLAPGTRCYLCGEIIEPTEKWNRDHVPPKRIFASQILKQFNPNLQWLPTHEACNSAYKADEEYFVISFAGHVITPTASAVFKDLRDAVRNGYSVGLLKEAISRFGKGMGPKGELLYSYATDRVQRFLWKLVRGLYYLELGIVLPEKTLGDIYLIDPYLSAGSLGDPLHLVIQFQQRPKWEVNRLPAFHQAANRVTTRPIMGVPPVMSVPFRNPLTLPNEPRDFAIWSHKLPGATAPFGC